jgi:fructosamine-3-kinase
MRAELAELAGLTGSPVERVSDLGPSHDWSLHRVRLADGREVFVKAGGSSGVLAAEAAGLRWLGEVAEDGLVTPVIGAAERLLVLPWRDSETPTTAAAERFGRALAALHSAPAESLGAPWEGFIATLPLDNTPGADWPSWYAQRRLTPFLKAAARHLDAAAVRLVEQVISSIEEIAGPAEPPSRIHGDLWSGNLLWSGGRAVLIDPAAHGGHRETDLAMLALFGAPHLDRILAAYQEVAPPADGWRERVSLHQLHPLLAHVALFGSAYRTSVVEAARTALGVR